MNYKIFYLIIFLTFNLLNAEVYFEKPENFHPKAHIVGCFLEKGPHILLLHRNDSVTQANTWAIPGGKVHHNETPLAAIIRELKEETTIEVHANDLTYIRELYITEPNFTFVYHMYKTSYQGNPVQIQLRENEHKGFTWVTPEDALTMSLMDNEDTCIKYVYSIE